MRYVIHDHVLLLIAKLAMLLVSTGVLYSAVTCTHQLVHLAPAQLLQHAHRIPQMYSMRSKLFCITGS
jgi:hypothetical protein